jgi:hypothetical protein
MGWSAIELVRADAYKGIVEVIGDCTEDCLLEFQDLYEGLPFKHRAKRRPITCTGAENQFLTTLAFSVVALAPAIGWTVCMARYRWEPKTSNALITEFESASVLHLQRRGKAGTDPKCPGL